jgi:two-component system sensor histidine kinase and response regulator WspE
MNDFSLLDLFREEVRVHAAALNAGLLALENEPGNAAHVEPLMRAAHSIKGAARIVNLDLAVRLAHVMEDAFVAAQDRRLHIGPPEIDLLLRGADILGELSTISDAAGADWNARHTGAIDELARALVPLAQGNSRPSAPPPTAPPAPPAPPAPRERAAIAIPRETLLGDDHGMLELFREEVRGNALLLHDGLLAPETSREQLEALTQAAHAIRGAAYIVEVEPAAQLARAMEDLLAAAGAGRTSLDGTARDALLDGVALLAQVIPLDDEQLLAWKEEAGAAVTAVCQLLRESAGSSSLPAAAPPKGRESNGDLTRKAEGSDEAPVAVHAPPPSTALAPARPTEQDDVPTQLAPAQAVRVVAAEPSEAVVRVTAQSLNRLMGLAGESLVRARWLHPFSTALLELRKKQDLLSGMVDQLAQALSTSGAPDTLQALAAQIRKQAGRCREILGERIGEFENHAAQAEDLNTRLYREVIVSRMRPFADGAHGFPRLVRDMARQLDKQVRLEIEGAQVEVDRDILERLEAPLTHLLRNALDHGIESPAQRRAAGKPETGIIRLVVQHRAGMLDITLNDDGAGIDLERLRTKVVERGMTTADMARDLTEAELLEFLFLPGFSTASRVSEYSGRGVGLDVVLDTVRKVGGSVRVTTRFGAGTRFHLQLPITLSVARAVLVQIAGEPYAFPHNRIDRLLRVPRSEVRSLENRQFLTLDGQNIALVVAAQLLELPVQPLDQEELPVVLMSDASGQYGLIVESFRGEQDLVVRPLDPRLGKLTNISAAAILDDGSPVLIADVEDLIRSMDHFIQTGSLQRCERRRRAATEKKRILVVDDSITVREVERQILRQRGYDVTTAVDGRDGWNLVREGDFDLVVSDVDMPRMNGLELVRALRQDESLRDLPVIIVSYKEREEDRLNGLEAGANYYLAKSSFHDNTFVEAVLDLIGEP